MDIGIIAQLPFQYPQETIGVILVIFYLILYSVGQKQNKYIALQFVENNIEIFRQQFQHVGVTKEAKGPLLSSESASSFRFFASGRQNCEFLMATIELKKRQDLLSYYLFTIAWPEKDQIQFDISLTNPQTIVFAILKSKEAKTYKESYTDLKYLTEKVIIDRLDSKTSLIALAEGKEPITTIIDNKIGQLLEKYEKNVVAIHLTDQKGLSQYPYQLRATFNNFNKLNQEQQNDIVNLVLALVDKIQVYKLPATLKQQYEQERQKLEEIKSKDEKLKRIEVQNQIILFSRKLKRKRQKSYKKKNKRFFQCRGTSKLKHKRRRGKKNQRKNTRKELCICDQLLCSLNIMYNYNRYITPQFSSNRNDSYYKPSSTMSYQSLAFKPTLYEQMTTKKDKFYIEDDIQLKPTLRSYRDQYQGFVVQNNKNLQFEFDQLRNKQKLQSIRLSNLMLSRMDEQDQFRQLFQEIEEMLQQVEKLKQKIDYFPQIFKETINSNEFLKIMHDHECTQIRLCDIELFFKQMNRDQSNFITKLKLKILLGQNEEKENQNNDNNLMIVFRILTIQIQITSLIEQKRQHFNKLGIRLNEIFDWLDLDKDNYWGEIDFEKRFPNIKLCFKYLTQNFGRSFDRETFLNYFRQQSQAKYI